MPKRRSLTVPIFGIIPSIKDVGLRNWLLNYSHGVQRFMRDVVEIGADYDLIAHVTRQTLTAGFTITPDSYEIEVTSASDVTSDATYPVRDGRSGQTIRIANVGTFSITIKDCNQVRLIEDNILTPGQTLSLRWSDSITPQWLSMGIGRLPAPQKGSIDVGVGNIGTGEDTLWTWTMPAYAMGYPPQAGVGMLVVRAMAYANGNANVKTLKFHLGGSSITLNPVTGSPNNITFMIVIEVWYQSSTTARVTAIVHRDGALEAAFRTNLSTSIDFSSPLVVKFTGTATADTDIQIVHAGAFVNRIY